MNRSGLPILGTAAEGEFSALLGPLSFSALPTRKRLEAAANLAAALTHMANTAVGTQVRYPLSLSYLVS
jgi:hypothetical protein